MEVIILLESQIYSGFWEKPIPYLFCGKTFFGLRMVTKNHFFKKLLKLDNIPKFSSHFGTHLQKMCFSGYY